MGMGRSRKLLDSAGVSYKRFQPNNIRPSPIIITHRRRTLAPTCLQNRLLIHDSAVSRALSLGFAVFFRQMLNPLISCVVPRPLPYKLAFRDQLSTADF